MGREIPKSSSQGLDTRLLELNAGETAIITFAPDQPGGVSGRVNWLDGGVSWSLKAQNDGDAIDVAVDYSLFDKGDEDWTPHQESPFTETHQDAETYRISRMRFTNNSGVSIWVSISSNAKYNG